MRRLPIGAFSPYAPVLNTHKSSTGKGFIRAGWFNQVSARERPHTLILPVETATSAEGRAVLATPRNDSDRHPVGRTSGGLKREVTRGVRKPRSPRHPPTGKPMADGGAKYTATLLSVSEIESTAVQSATPASAKDARGQGRPTSRYPLDNRHEGWRWLNTAGSDENSTTDEPRGSNAEGHSTADDQLVAGWTYRKAITPIDSGASGALRTEDGRGVGVQARDPEEMLVIRGDADHARWMTANEYQERYTDEKHPEHLTVK